MKEKTEKVAALIFFQGNDIRLFHNPRRGPSSFDDRTGFNQFTVPLIESEWEREDGGSADREHLLMALADLQYVNIRANYLEGSQLQEVG